MIKRSRWEEIWQKLQAREVPDKIFDELISTYSSPDRFYHNLAHVEDCLFLFDQTEFLAVHPGEVELAIWFHDSVYDPRRSDNEQKSAAWAEAVIRQAGLGSEIAERVSRSILATRHHVEVIDRDARLVADVDLSILGREADVFWTYEENIRKEYAWVPANVFRQKRAENLRSFLDRPCIYHHDEYRRRFEEKARANLNAAIARLTEPTDTD